MGLRTLRTLFLGPKLWALKSLHRPPERIPPKLWAWGERARGQGGGAQLHLGLLEKNQGIPGGHHPMGLGTETDTLDMVSL